RAKENASVLHRGDEDLLLLTPTHTLDSRLKRTNSKPTVSIGQPVVRTKTHDINTEDMQRESVLCKQCLRSLAPFVK
ncbi:uncharacterized, partial [Tachysurus ichikawai]